MPAPDRDTAPPRRPDRALAMSLVIGLGACAALAGCRTAAGHVDTVRHSFTGVHRVVVTSGPGDVRLVRGTGADVQVTLSRHWTGTRPEPQVTQAGDVLTVSSRCADQGGGDGELGDCTVDARVTVPAGAAVQVTTSAGSIAATTLDVVSFDARTRAGSVTATFASVPNSVRAESNAGDVTISVPSDDYDVDAGTDVGSSHVDVVDDPRSPRSIYAHTQVGDVSVSRS